MRTDIIAGDMHGDMVAPGDTVLFEDKPYIIKELFEEHDEVTIGLEDEDGSVFVVDEDRIELVSN
jgi:hypothetical protein